MLIYSTSTEALFVVPFDVRRLRVTGTPIRLPDVVPVVGNGLGRAAVSRSGSLLCASGSALGDLVLIDPRIEVGVLRGAPMTHPKHSGRRIFGSGINLTQLYQGQISLVEFMLERELGCVSKMLRGLSPERVRDDGLEEGRTEKPFLAAVDAWAIGGACQWLLVMDAVVAERGSFFNLPARKEGIIPGCANLRLPRFVGERLAQQAIFMNLEFQADSTSGRLLADRVVDSDRVETEVLELARELTAAGPTSLVANRRALRAAHEPLDVFRRYLATYAIEQARCLYSPGLIDNLERNWDAKRRSLA